MARRVFTPAAIQIIRNLADEGKSAGEIADLLGSTAASVRVKCCQHKIRLSRRRHPSLIPSLGRRKLVVYIPPEDYAALERQAGHMRKSVVDLAASLLEAIIRANIYDAVLDDHA